MLFEQHTSLLEIGKVTTKETDNDKETRFK